MPFLEPPPQSFLGASRAALAQHSHRINDHFRIRIVKKFDGHFFQLRVRVQLPDFSQHVGVASRLVRPAGLHCAANHGCSACGLSAQAVGQQRRLL